MIVMSLSRSSLVVTALCLLVTRSALADAATSTTEAPLRLGQEVQVAGKSYFVERVGDDGKLVLSPPQQPTEVAGAFIKPVGASSSSFQSGVRGPGRLIDGSGLAETFPRSGVYVHTSDAFAGGSSMWNSTGDDVTAWVQFDLGQAFRVNGVYVWNYNESGEWSAYGVKNCEVLASDDGATFTKIGSFTLRRGTGRGDEKAQFLKFADVVTSRYFRIQANSNFGKNQTGLSEVRFANADVAYVPPTPWVAKYPRPTHPKVAKVGDSLEGTREIRFPADARVVDVTQPPYSAKGDGITDDTTAIQKALDDHPNAGAIIYLPNGHYLVSKTLRWPAGKHGETDFKRTLMMGQSRQGAVLRLKDSAPGFENPQKPAAVLYCGKAPAQRFGNEIHSLTVDTGVDNPGASGVMFIANNQGGMYDVTIVSGDGQGVSGLNLAYTDEQGPELIRNVKVVGFDIGVHAAFAVASITFEHIEVEQQNRAGFRNDGQPASVRKLVSRNTVPAVVHTGGLLTLIDTELIGLPGAEKSSAAIESSGELFARNVTTTTYPLAIVDRIAGKQSPTGTVAEYRTSPARSFDRAAAITLNLPIKESPEAPVDPVDAWASPTQFGGKPDDNADDSDAIQKAIDSGAKTVYLPRGVWRINKTVELRANLVTLIGTRPWLVPGGEVRAGQPMFRHADGSSSLTVIDGLHTDFSEKITLIENASRRTLAMRRIMCNFQGGVTYRNSDGATGEVFLDDVVGGQFRFKGQSVWARQFNPEPRGTKVINDAGTLWILGLKCERGGTIIESVNGARTELLGGLSQTHDGSQAPMFINRDSDVSLVFSEVNNSDDPYRQIVVEHNAESVQNWDEPNKGFRGFRLVAYEARLRKQ
jgi:hypothetical protein